MTALAHLRRLVQLTIRDFQVDLTQDLEEEQKVPLVLANSHEVVEEGVPSTLRVVYEEDGDNHLRELVEYQGGSCVVRREPAVHELTQKCLVLLLISFEARTATDETSGSEQERRTWHGFLTGT